MKRILICLFFAPLFTFAQNDLPRIEKDTLFTTSGFKAIAGTDIKLGAGTLPNGDFKYITESAASFNAIMSGTTSRPEAVNRKWNGHMFHIKKFRKEGNKKRGFTYYLILGGGNISNYECDAESAITAGELIVPDEFRPKAAGATPPATSASDELKKLKDLFDGGALTKDEYDSAKKKIISKM